MRQYMVRIMRSSDDEYADVVVNAETEFSAKMIALNLVNARPALYFDDPEPPTYHIDESSDVEDVTGGEYESVNRVP